MNKATKSIAAVTLVFLVGMLASPQYRVRAEAAWEILFNGKTSKAQVIQTDSGPLVNVSFPVPQDGEVATYGVKLEKDLDSKQIKIIRVKKKGPLRERGDCPKCSGSKECQDCYPAGSGVGTSGDGCYYCNASGDCAFCSGSGVCYTCDGAGFPNGCNTCGDVSN